MIIFLTGTPGTGKTTISLLLAEKLGCKLVDINHLVEEKHLFSGVDSEKGYKVVDMDDLEEELQNIIKKENDMSNDPCILIEGHLSHYFPGADFVFVFRTAPPILEERLQKRVWKIDKIRENIEAEALDVCTWEAYQVHGKNVHEIDTSNITPEKAVNIISDIIMGKKLSPPGNIDFSSYLG